MRIITISEHHRNHRLSVAIAAITCLVMALAWPSPSEGIDVDGPFVPVYVWADNQGGREDNVGDPCTIPSMIPGIVSDTPAQLVVRGDHDEIVGVLPLQGTFEPGSTAGNRLSCAVRTSVLLDQSLAYVFTINEIRIQTFDRDNLPVDDPLVIGVDPASLAADPRCVPTAGRVAEST
jgi:hypothetical protein